MSWYPDMGHETMVAIGEHVRAVGWLSSDQPYACGTVPAEFIERLREFVRLANESADALYFAAFGARGGFFTCEFCGDAHDNRNFGVPSGEVLFVAPGMMLHYVEQHGYAPPVEFIATVLASPLPGTPEYELAVQSFRQMHEKWWRKFFEQQAQSE